MKSLRHIGLAVVLSLGASQVIAMDAPAVKPGFFTKENAMQLWTSCKNGFSAGCNKVAAGYNKSVDFLKPYGTQALTWIKNHKKTSIAIAASAAVLAAAGLAYKAGLFAKIARLFKKSEGKKTNAQQQGGCGVQLTKKSNNETGDNGMVATHVDQDGRPRTANGQRVFKTF